MKNKVILFVLFFFTTAFINYAQTVAILPADSETYIVDGDTYDFGSHLVESYTYVTFFLINGSSSVNLNLTLPLVISGEDASAFRVEYQPSSPVPPLFELGRTSFTVRFGPADAGIMNASITIASNDPTSPFVLNLRGTSINNSPPTAADGSVTGAQDVSFSIPTENFHYSDVDADEMWLVEITTLPELGTLYIDLNDNGTNDGGWESSSDPMIIEGSDLDLGRLKFVSALHGSGSPYTTFTFKVNDRHDFSVSTYTMTINVTAPNAPVLDAIEGTTLSYTAGDAATAITSSITVSDADNTNIESAMIQITGNYQNGQDVLSFTNQLGITGTWNAGTGTMTLNGTAVLADYQTALRAVKYRNTSSTPITLLRTISFKVNDGTDPSNTVTRNVSIVDYDPWVDKTISPANNQTGVSIWTTQITWSAFGSGHYDFMLFKDGTSIGGGTQVGTTQNNLTTLYATIVSPLEYETEYYWYIKDNSASEWDEFHFTTASTSAAYLLTPANGSTNYGTTIQFNWLSYATGVVFDLVLDDDPLVGSSTTLVSGLSVFYYSYDGSSLIPGQTYYWKVITKTTGGSVTGTSSAWSFTMPGLPVPTAYYPSGGTIAYVNPPTLYWYSSSYSSSNTYIVRYWKDGQTPPTSETSQTNLTGYFNTGSANVSTLLTATLDAGATYHWGVALTNGSSTSSWSSPTASFVVYSSLPITPPVPYPSWPVGGNTSYLNPPTLYWYLGIYATGLQFNVEWDDDLNWEDTPLGSSGWITNYYYTIITDLSAGTIHWRVQSRIGSSGTPSAWSSVVNFVMPSSSGAVPTPTIIYPTGGAVVYSLSQYLYWFAYSTSTLEYQVNISESPDVIGGELSTDNTFYPSATTYTANLYYALSGLTAGHTYYWQVKARLVSSSSTESSWSTVASFTTAAGSFAVIPLVGSPDHGLSINNTSVVLTWILPTQSESPLSYEVEYSKNKDMSNAISISCENKPFAELNGLDTKTTYYWRVKSKTDNGFASNYSAIGSFKTDKLITSVKEAEIPTEFSLMQNYPNPFNPTTYISYSIPKSSFVTLKIYDMLGKEVKTLVNEDVNAGKISVVWSGEDNNGNKVASGTYVYRITAGDFVSAKKMILVK